MHIVGGMFMTPTLPSNIRKQSVTAVMTGMNDAKEMHVIPAFMNCYTLPASDHVDLY